MTTESDHQQENNNNDRAAAALGQHAQNDAALRTVRDDDAETGATRNNSSSSSSSSSITMGRVFVFFVFPITMGVLGVYMAHLEKMRKQSAGQEFRELSLDQDFVMPFLLALAMSVVLYIQTSGFATKEVKPLVAWPKVRRVKKVVRKKKSSASNEEPSEDAIDEDKKDK